MHDAILQILDWSGGSANATIAVRLSRSLIDDADFASAFHRHGCSIDLVNDDQRSRGKRRCRQCTTNVHEAGQISRWDLIAAKCYRRYSGTPGLADPFRPDYVVPTLRKTGLV
ncbi:hypothetical protein LIA77_06286 [Sarocladium implicatum]|nr:hypothetical protein LIA77_06286 [Sarocladium implicatum]